MNGTKIWIYISLGSIILGSVSPWEQIIPGVNTNGTDFGGDGGLLIAVAAGAGAFFYRWCDRRRAVIPLVIAGLIGIATTLYDWHRIVHPARDPLLGLAVSGQVEWGLFLTLLASASVILAGVAFDGILRVRNGRATSAQRADDGHPPIDEAQNVRNWT